MATCTTVAAGSTPTGWKQKRAPLRLGAALGPVTLVHRAPPSRSLRANSCTVRGQRPERVGDASCEALVVTQPSAPKSGVQRANPPIRCHAGTLLFLNFSSVQLLRLHLLDSGYLGTGQRCLAGPGRESVLVVAAPSQRQLLSHPNSMRGNAGHMNLWLRYRSRRVWGRVRVAVREAQDERHDVMDAPAWRIVVSLVARRGRRGYWRLIRPSMPSSIRSIIYGRTWSGVMPSRLESGLRLL
jgi:hypothetical protein